MSHIQHDRSLRNAFIALFISVAVLGCQALGVPSPKTFNERLASGYASVTAARTTATTLLNGSVITSSDAENVLKTTDSAREGLDISRGLQGLSAEQKLESALTILQAAQVYLCTKAPNDPNCAGVL